ncbi:hypothetical protein V6O07_03220, partial [Arthrospira platensis SPKY2]
MKNLEEWVAYLESKIGGNMIEILKFKLLVWKLKKIALYISTIFKTNIEIKYEKDIGFLFSDHTVNINPFTGENRVIENYTLIQGFDIVRDINNPLYKNKLYFIWYQNMNLLQLIEIKNKLKIFRDTVYKLD